MSKSPPPSKATPTPANESPSKDLTRLKRAIVAIARTLLLRMRRMLLDKQIYALKLAA